MGQAMQKLIITKGRRGDYSSHREEKEGRTSGLGHSRGNLETCIAINSKELNSRAKKSIRRLSLQDDAKLGGVLTHDGKIGGFQNTECTVEARAGRPLSFKAQERGLPAVSSS
uniref:Uncharacterized protein n=1 Tax=Strigamia maritima TaxID=126957 RepID=T1IMV8_STRMM